MIDTIGEKYRKSNAPCIWSDEWLSGNENKINDIFTDGYYDIVCAYVSLVYFSEFNIKHLSENRIRHFPYKSGRFYPESESKRYTEYRRFVNYFKENSDLPNSIYVSKEKDSKFLE